MTGVGEILRLARPAEADQIAKLLLPYAARDLVLPRSATEIREQARNFVVAARRGKVVGCVSLRDYGNGLWEIRSLAVREGAAGHGLGTRLVQAALRLARRRRAGRVFALTLRPHIFARLGFGIVEKELFPQKVWTDCKRCKKREVCDEIAVLLPVKLPLPPGSPTNGGSRSAR